MINILITAMQNVAFHTKKKNHNILEMKEKLIEYYLYN